MKPFLLGKKNLEVEALRPAHQHGAGKSALGAVGASAATGPTVEAVKQGDKVVRLIVTCACGERIEIDCLYPAGS